jgi:predicted nucleic acid-binding protein
VVSEFVNRFSRLKWDELKRFHPTTTPATFKDFRNSPDFVPIAVDVVDALRRIRKNAYCIDDGFSSMDFEAILVAFEGGSTDINDQMIARLCRAEGITLITDDADFKNLDVTLLTANNRLLN